MVPKFRSLSRRRLFAYFAVWKTTTAADNNNSWLPSRWLNAEEVGVLVGVVGEWVCVAEGVRCKENSIKSSTLSVAAGKPALI